MNKIELKEDERIDQLYANDAVLLAHFAEPTKKENGKVVDLCAGNGAVGLFLTSKTKASIAAVEIQPKLAEMAKRSVKLNSLEQQVTVLNLDLNDSLKYLKKVTCNPPYFSDLPTSKKNPNPYLALARHEITVTLAQTIEMSSALLKTKGKAYFVHRPDRLFEIFECMQKNRLAPKKVQLVYPKEGREANMVLVEAIKDGRKGGLRFLPPITVYQANDEYTPEMRGILYGTAG